MRPSQLRDVQDRRDILVFEAEEARLWLQQLAQRAQLLLRACEELPPTDPMRIDAAALAESLAEVAAPLRCVRLAAIELTPPSPEPGVEITA